MRKWIFFLCLLAAGLKTFGQTRKAAVDSLERNYERCLSNGQNMYGCALTYYHQLDSMLNLVYRQLYARLDTSHRKTLRVEQVQWQERRKAYFKLLDMRVQKVHKKTLAGLDDHVIATDHKAAYIKDRVTELLEDFPKKG